jgi:hypothetical protein
MLLARGSWITQVIHPVHRRQIYRLLVSKDAEFHVENAPKKVTSKKVNMRRFAFSVKMFPVFIMKYTGTFGAFCHKGKVLFLKSTLKSALFMNDKFFIPSFRCRTVFFT